MGGRDGERPDAVVVLKSQHEPLRDALAELEALPASEAARRAELFRVADALLRAHLRAEETHFDPVFRRAAGTDEDRKLHHEASAEHALLEAALAQLADADPASETFSGRAKVLKNLFDHHAEEEEKELLPRSRQIIDAGELVELAARIDGDAALGRETRRKSPSALGPVARRLRDSSLTLALVAMFLVSLVGHLIAGYRAAREDEAQHGGVTTTSLWEYATSGHFLESLFENWESEFLQMAMYVVFTIFLFQRGSAESKDPEVGSEPPDEDPRLHRHDPRAPWPVRRGGWALRLYGSSLSIALALLFAASFALHAVAGRVRHNDEARRHGEAEASLAEYMGGAEFWFESFQNWQSEFLSIAALVVLSIFLRQRGSPESKPVHSPHDRTGKG